MANHIGESDTRKYDKKYTRKENQQNHMQSLFQVVGACSTLSLFALHLREFQVRSGYEIIR